jgi:magnesium transporter
MNRFEHQWPELKWIDLEEPNEDVLTALAAEFGFPMHTLVSSLDPEHLPKCEFLEAGTFLILRHFDKTANDHAATMQELTTKLIVITGADFVVTIHRGALPGLEKIRSQVLTEIHDLSSFVRNTFCLVVNSFEHPLEALESKTELIEGRVFALKKKNVLREGYKVKRRASTYRKVFKFTNDVFMKLQGRVEFPLNDLSEAKEPLDRLYFYADNIHEEITGLLNLHVSLMAQKTNDASFRTSEVMRILTVFSIFFLPLNFLAGLYGMNFEHIPGLKTYNGFVITLFGMFVIAVAILVWMYRKGWLKKEDF